MSTPERPESRALEALTALLRSSVKAPTATQLDQGLEALHARLAGRRYPERLRWSLAALGALCILATAVLVFVVRSRSHGEPPVAMSRIEGGQVLDGGYLSEAGHAGIKLFFNEGSQFVLDPGTRGRLRSVASDGARVAIDRGRASFQITKSPQHRWWVEAGPFLVLVTGTEFSVSWEPAGEQFEVRLQRGRVSVSGPVLGEELVLRPGQRLRVNLPKGETVITQASGELEQGEAPSSNASATPATTSPSPMTDESTPPLASAAQPRASATNPDTERHWSEALAKGQWDLILADVERDGLSETLQTASSRDLFALADAARYRRRTDWARAALLAQRQRFPGSPRSLDVAFLLGRVEEASGKGKEAALKWYDEYLGHSATGTYAAEALGRKLILTQELRGAAGARNVAEQYLQRFPNGTYAATARALTDR